jgi:hypothetical protein
VPPGDLPTALEHFVLQKLRSLDHLDALVAMYREPTKWWTGEMLAQSVGTSVGAAERLLDDLCSASLLKVRITSALMYQYSPASEEMERLVADLVDALRHARVRIYTLITSRSSRALHEFADAFRFRSGKRG